MSLFFLIPEIVQAQDKVFTSTKNRQALKLYMQSDEYMLKKQYGKAEYLLLKAIEKDSYYVDALMRLSSIYYKNGKQDKEKAIYEQVIRVKPEYPFIYFNYGHLLMRELEYKKAIESFNKFLTMPNTSIRFQNKAATNIKICEFRIDQMENPVPFDPVNVGTGINTPEGEYWPVLTADDEHLYFTRLQMVDTSKRVGYGKYNEDIFSSTMVDGKWNKAIPLPGYLNSRDKNEGAIAISPDGTFLLFTICSDDPRFGYGWCDIYYSEYRKGKWQKARNIGPPINTRMKETQPSISFDGKTIYFSSNRRGTKGKLDLWKSTKQEDGRWGEPVNLGSAINTKGNEQSPFIHADDQTLYFSTDHKMGMGKSDLFIARKNTAGEFTMVTNLSYPINTHESEMALFVSARGRKAYFASRVEGGEGELDIYQFDLPARFRPRPVCYLKGVVFDIDTKAKLGAKFELVDLETGKMVVESYSDDLSGEFLVTLPALTNYALNVSKNGYLFYSEHLPLKNIKSTAYEHDVPLVPIKVGKSTILRNVFFDTDKYILKPKSITELKKVIAFMKENPTVRIELSGHTDNQGTIQHNQTLSENRAKAVYNYLVDKGNINPKRLTYKGYGESKPIETNEIEDGRAVNRRTELKVIGK